MSRGGRGGGGGAYVAENYRTVYLPSVVSKIIEVVNNMLVDYFWKCGPFSDLLQVFSCDWESFDICSSDGLTRELIISGVNQAVVLYISIIWESSIVFFKKLESG